MTKPDILQNQAGLTDQAPSPEPAGGIDQTIEDDPTLKTRRSLGHSALITHYLNELRSDDPEMSQVA